MTNVALTENSIGGGVKIGPHLVCREKDLRIGGGVGIEAGFSTGGDRADRSIRFIGEHGYSNRGFMVGPTLGTGIKKTTWDADPARMESNFREITYGVASTGAIIRFCPERNLSSARDISCVALGLGTEIPLTHRDSKGARATGNIFFGIGF